MTSHSEKTRAGLRRARKNGVALGGLRSATMNANAARAVAARQRAMAFRDVLEAGQGRTLKALSADLFAAGCTTATGKPLTASMVKRMRERLVDALQEESQP